MRRRLGRKRVHSRRESQFQIAWRRVDVGALLPSGEVGIEVFATLLAIGAVADDIERFSGGTGDDIGVWISPGIERQFDFIEIAAGSEMAWNGGGIGWGDESCQTLLACRDEAVVLFVDRDCGLEIFDLEFSRVHLLFLRESEEVDTDDGAEDDDNRDGDQNLEQGEACAGEAR